MRQQIELQLGVLRAALDAAIANGDAATRDDLRRQIDDLLRNAYRQFRQAARQAATADEVREAEDNVRWVEREQRNQRTINRAANANQAAGVVLAPNPNQPPPLVPVIQNQPNPGGANQPPAAIPGLVRPARPGGQPPAVVVGAVPAGAGGNAGGGAANPPAGNAAGGGANPPAGNPAGVGAQNHGPQAAVHVAGQPINFVGQITPPGAAVAVDRTWNIVKTVCVAIAGIALLLCAFQAGSCRNSQTSVPPPSGPTVQTVQPYTPPVIIVQTPPSQQTVQPPAPPTSGPDCREHWLSHGLNWVGHCS